MSSKNGLSIPREARKIDGGLAGEAGFFQFLSDFWQRVVAIHPKRREDA